MESTILRAVDKANNCLLGLPAGWENGGADSE